MSMAFNILKSSLHFVALFKPNAYTVDPSVVMVDKVHWIFQVRADKIKPLFTPKV
jgi:hypothetical protein